MGSKGLEGLLGDPIPAPSSHCPAEAGQLAYRGQDSFEEENLSYKALEVELVWSSGSDYSVLG